MIYRHFGGKLWHWNPKTGQGSMVDFSIVEPKGSGNTRWHAVYPKPISSLARLHKVGAAAINGWIRRGKEVGQLPPLTSRQLTARWKRKWYGTHAPASYAKSCDEYAATYDTTSRSIKRWVYRGKLVRCLPPLDNPRKLRNWLARYMRQSARPCQSASATQPWLIEPSASENPKLRTISKGAWGTDQALSVVVMRRGDSRQDLER